MLITNTLLLLLFFMVQLNGEPLFLTPHIIANRTIAAKNMSAVNGLPNAPTVESYSGYITVDKQYDSNLFFWFFPSFNNVRSQPVVIWLAGGPSQSSIWSIFSYNPVFKFNENNSLYITPYAWAQNFSMLYIDNPVGTGFSFTRNQSGYSNDMNSVANNLYEFLQQFFAIFEEYRDNELYITGESYAGKYIPALGYKLMSNESNINFKGIALGNPFMDPINQMNLANILKSLGLIDKKELKFIKNSEEEIRTAIRNQNFQEAYSKRQVLWTTVYHDFLKQSIHLPSVYDLSQFRKDWQIKDFQSFFRFLYSNETEQALHVDISEFDFINYKVREHLFNDFFISIEKNFTELIDKYKVMIYIGNFDTFVGIDAIAGMLENPEWKYYNDFYHAEKKEWKVDHDDEEMAGFVKSFGNFTFAVVRNAGHYVAYDKPRALQNLINRFISNEFNLNDI